MPYINLHKKAARDGRAEAHALPADRLERDVAEFLEHRRESFMITDIDPTAVHGSWEAYFIAGALEAAGCAHSRGWYGLPGVPSRRPVTARATLTEYLAALADATNAAAAARRVATAETTDTPVGPAPDAVLTAATVLTPKRVKLTAAVQVKPGEAGRLEVVDRGGHAVTVECEWEAGPVDESEAADSTA